MAVMDAEIRDAIYTAAAVGLRGGDAMRSKLPTDGGIALTQARLVRFLSEIDGDLTVSDLLEQMRDGE
jgi:hypothetical protein